MRINWSFLARAYFFPALIIIAALALLTGILTPAFGPAFGTFTAYVVQFIIICMALWASRKVEKAIK